MTALEARDEGLTLSFVQQSLMQEEQKRHGVPQSILSDGQSSALLGGVKRK